MLIDILGFSEAELLGFLLALLRIASMIMAAPILGSRSVPPQVKVFFSLLLTVLMLPALRADPGVASLTLTAMLPLAIKEVSIGLFLGFCAKLLFESFQFAGRLISTQMGLGMANLVDPDNGMPSTPIGNIYGMVAIMFFLLLNGHHMLLEAMTRSFQLAPVSDLRLMQAGAGRYMVRMFNTLFVTGIKLAAPSMATLFLMEVCMGIMARMVPQMNIFFVGLPIRLGVGMFILIASLPVFYVFFSALLGDWKRDLSSLLTYF